jgi:hypothetical protein
MTRNAGAVFLVLTWASGGLLRRRYAAASGHPFLGSVAAWVPWSVLRVFAFVLLGTVFSRPLLVLRVWPFGPQEYKLMALALSGILADIGIKSFFTPSYGIFLRQMARSAAGLEG